MTNDRFPRALCGFVLALAVLGCKERPAVMADVGAPAVASPGAAALTAGPRRVAVKIWFLDGERMKTGTEPLFVPVEREVPEPNAMRGALDLLFAGPTEEEQLRGLRFVRSQATGYEELRVEAGVAHVRLKGGCDSGGATATIANELMPTLKQFPEVLAVKIYDPSGKTEESERRVDSIPFCLEP